jgi:purine-binding chemotaxis protein CheW
MSENNMLFITEDLLDRQEEVAVEEKTDKYLIFVSDQLLYGLYAEQVVEIITSHVITHLPRVPDYVRGIINLRGQIIPIVDIRLRLGREAQEDCCIIVVDVEGSLIGILVDEVEKMVGIPDEAILPMPTQRAQKIISGMCSLPEGGTVLILDCGLLLRG